MKVLNVSSEAYNDVLKLEEIMIGLGISIESTSNLSINLKGKLYTVGCISFPRDTDELFTLEEGQ